MLPLALHSGASIGLIAPSGPFDRNVFERGLTTLESWGFTPVYDEGFFERDGYLAGDDDRRLDELHRQLDNDTCALLAVRGGYGVHRLLSRLDPERVKRSEKLLMGFSDISGLHLAWRRFGGPSSLHGPNLTGLANLNENLVKRWLGLVSGVQTAGDLHDSPLMVLRGGRAEGPLLPTNLCLLSTLMGTGFLPEFDGVILALEDVGEALYRIDRMLHQLALAGVFSRVAGVILGQFTPPGEVDVAQRADFERAVAEIVLDVTKNARVPVFGGFPFGHEANNHPLPVGVPCAINDSTCRLTLLSPPGAALKIGGTKFRESEGDDKKSKTRFLRVNGVLETPKKTAKKSATIKYNSKPFCNTSFVPFSVEMHFLQLPEVHRFLRNRYISWRDALIYSLYILNRSFSFYTP